MYRSRLSARGAVRPLTMLKRRGHPMSVAEGHLPSQHLIGPAMLPAYWRTVKIAVSVILAIAVALCAIFSGPARHAAPALGGVAIWVWLFWVTALAYVGMFTLIFAAVECGNRRAQAAGTWDPRDPDGLAPADPEADARRSMRANAVAGVVVARGSGRDGGDGRALAEPHLAGDAAVHRRPLRDTHGPARLAAFGARRGGPGDGAARRRQVT